MFPAPVAEPKLCILQRLLLHTVVDVEGRRGVEGGQEVGDDERLVKVGFNGFKTQIPVRLGGNKRQCNRNEEGPGVHVRKNVWNIK